MKRLAACAAITWLIWCFHFQAVLAQENGGGAGAHNDASTIPVVKLIDAGQGERRLLRLKLQKGATETAVAEVALSTQTSFLGEQVNREMPVGRTTMRVETVEVADSGDAKLQLQIVDAQPVDKPRLSPIDVDRMRASMAKSIGVKGTATVTARNEIKELQFSPPAGADRQAPPPGEELKQSLMGQGWILPDLPVGRGAKWERTVQSEVRGAKTTQVFTYTLTELDGESASFTVEMKQSAPPQELGARDGAVATKLLKLEGVGTGKARVSFGRAIPLNFETAGTLNVVFENGGHRIEMAYKIRTMLASHPAAK